MREIETRRWDVAEHLDSDEAIAAYLTIVFQDGDAAETRDALNHAARAKRRDRHRPAGRHRACSALSGAEKGRQSNAGYAARRYEGAGVKLSAAA